MDSRFFMEYLKDTPETLGRLADVYDRISAEGTLKRTFCDGTVRTKEEFLADIVRVGSLPFLAFWEGEPAGLAWYNTLEGRTARGHYVFFKSVWGRKTSSLIGRCINEQFLTFRDTRGYLFDLILGLVPKRNTLGWKFPLYCGAFLIGEIPHGAYIADEDKSETAVLVGITRESLGLGGK